MSTRSWSGRPGKRAVVPLYLDDCLIDKDVARPLRAAGHLIYVTNELASAAMATTHMWQEPPR